MECSAVGNTNEPVIFSEVTENGCYKSRANLMENSFSGKTADMTELKMNKSPKRLLHFSDGVLEEYSSDEDEPDGKPVPEHTQVNPKTLTWGPWTWHYVSAAGGRTLQVCDYLGESLANFFGITSPKYQYEIEEFYRAKAEEEEHRQKQDLEMRGWTEKKATEGEMLVVEVAEPRTTETPAADRQELPDSRRY